MDINVSHRMKMKNEENISKPTFYEIIVLLALNDKGWFGLSENRVRFGLAGAVLFMLLRSGSIRITGNTVVVTDKIPTGDQVNDAVLEMLRKQKKNLTLKNVLRKIVYKSGLKVGLLLRSLIRKKILERQELRFLSVFYLNKYLMVNPDLKKEILADLYSKILDKRELSEDDLMLLAVMKSCRMIGKNFSGYRHFLKVRLRIREITKYREPLSETSRNVKAIGRAIGQLIRESKIMIHA